MYELCGLRLNLAMNEDRLYVLSANPHYAVPEESKQYSVVDADFWGAIDATSSKEMGSVGLAHLKEPLSSFSAVFIVL